MKSNRETNIYAQQGSNYYETFVAINPTTNSILNLTGYTIYGQVRKWFDVKNYVYFNTGIINASTGSYYLSLNLDDSVALYTGRNVYDVVAVDVAGYRTVIKSGQFIVDPGLTFINPTNSDTVDTVVILEIIQGSKFTHIFEVRNPDGSFFDLTGYSVVMQLRPSASSPVLFAEYSTANTKLTTTATQGKINLSLTSADTSILQFDTAVYDVEITNTTTGLTERIAGGEVVLNLNVTK